MIRGIPTLLLFKDGKVVDTIVGLVDKNDLSRTIDKHL
jgi:thioredoxin 1